MYEGVALGWAGAYQWFPPSPLVGTRAVWQGVEYAADLAGDDTVLTVFSDPESPQWARKRFGAWVRVVPTAECEIFELVAKASWNGVPVRVLEIEDRVARVLLEESDPDVVLRLSTIMAGHGVFIRYGVPVDELTDLEVCRRRSAKPPSFTGRGCLNRK